MRYYCIKQHDERDCAAACIATICHDFGIDMPVAYYRKKAKTNINGTSMYGIVDALNSFGFEADAYQVTVEELFTNRELKFPMIAMVVNEHQMYHFLVVNKLCGNKLYISDPDKGKKMISMQDFSHIFTGYIVMMNNHDKKPAVKTNSVVMDNIWRIFFQNKRRIVYIILSSFFIMLLGFLISIGIGYAFQILENDEMLTAKYGEVSVEIIEAEHERGDTTEEAFEELYLTAVSVLWLKQNLWQLIAVLIVAVVGNSLTGWLKQKAFCDLTADFQKDIFKTLNEKIFDLEQTDMDAWKTGDIMKRYQDAEDVSNGFISAILTLIVDTILAVLGGTMLYLLNGKLFAIILFMLLCYAAVIAGFVKPMKKHNIKFMEYSTIQNTLIKEMLDGMTDLKMYGAQEAIKQSVSEKTENYIKWLKKTDRMNSGQEHTISFFSGAAQIALAAVSFVLISDQKMTISAYITFSAMIGYFLNPIEALANLQGTIQKSIVSAKRLSDILDIPKEKKEEKSALTNFTGMVKIENNKIRYGNQLPVLENFSEKKPSGKHTLIHGKNGCGKSTLAKLIAGVYETEQGVIFYEDKDIRQLNKSDLHKHVLYVAQKSAFLSESLRENICFGMEGVTDAELDKVCKIAEIKSFIANLPQGYETFVEENGRNFSTGECQKLALARALLRKPKILILDEATSNIEKESEAKIYANIKKEQKEITIISVMHSPNKMIAVDHEIKM